MQETTSKKTSYQDASYSAREAVKKKSRNSTPLDFKVSEEFHNAWKHVQGSPSRRSPGSHEETAKHGHDD
jgi:hypothetical protein